MKNRSDQELKSNLNSIKAITIELLFTITILIVLSAYGLLTKKNNSTFIALITAGISCFSILLLQYINMNKIKPELDSRKK